MAMSRSNLFTRRKPGFCCAQSIDDKGGNDYIARESWRTLNAQKAGQRRIYFCRHLKIRLVARPDGFFSKSLRYAVFHPQGAQFPDGSVSPFFSEAS